MVAVAVAISLLFLAGLTVVVLVLDPEWLDDQPVPGVEDGE